jgi:short subunit fatty acids transporter
MALRAIGVRLAAVAIGFGFGVVGGAVEAKPVSEAAVVKTYADIAQAAYEDSLATAKGVQAAIKKSYPSQRRPIWRALVLPGLRRGFPISRPKHFVSATRLSMTGKAR